MTRFAFAIVLYAASGAAWAGGIILKTPFCEMGSLVFLPREEGNELICYSTDAHIRVPNPEDIWGECLSNGDRWPARVNGNEVTCYEEDRPTWLQSLGAWLRSSKSRKEGGK